MRNFRQTIHVKITKKSLQFKLVDIQKKVECSRGERTETSVFLKTFELVS